MTLKRITITQDAYTLLLNSKLEKESFSQEITRILSKKKTKKFSDFFGILSEKEGEELLVDLAKIKEANLSLLKKRIHETT